MSPSPHFLHSRASAGSGVPGASSPLRSPYDSDLQCDVYPYMLMEHALDLAALDTLEQRDARSWQAQRQRPLRWVLAASLLISGVGVWWLA